MNRDNKRLGTASFNLTRLCHNKKIINIILIINILQKQNQQCNKKIFIPRSAGERGGWGRRNMAARKENIQKYEKEGRKDGEEELRSCSPRMRRTKMGNNGGPRVKTSRGGGERYAVGT